MSQSSLEERFKEAGLKVHRGVKTRNTNGEARTPTQTGSDIWLYRWAKNSYRNYPVVSRAKGVRILDKSCSGYPAVIVGIGPSLDESIPALKKAAGHAIVIATDAAFRVLLANGITPDLVITYDCKPEQKLLWEGIPYHNVPLLIDSCAHPDTVAAWKGPILFYNHFHQTDQLSHVILPHVYPTIGQLPSGGTVGNVALLLSKFLDCSPTIAVGMDFCYASTENGWRYRSQDYQWDILTGAWFPTEIKELYDNDERIARSFMTKIKGFDFRMDPELGFYHETFVNFVTYFKVNTINCSPTGALKDFVATMTLESALERFSLKHPHEIPFTKIINEIGIDPRIVS